MAAVIALALALPLAFLSAMRPGGPADAAIRSTFQVGLSTPVFYLGLILLSVFAARLGWSVIFARPVVRSPGEARFLMVESVALQHERRIRST